MTNHEGSPSELWYRSSPRNMLLFATMWLSEFFLILWFFKWLLHASPKIYFFIIPWALFGSVMVFRPNWIAHLTQFFELNTDRLDKWNPPSFP